MVEEWPPGAVEFYGKGTEAQGKLLKKDSEVRFEGWVGQVKEKANADRK